MSYLRWDILPRIPENHPLQHLALPPLIKQLLYNRGIDSVEEANLYLSADKQLAADPMELPDIEPALNRIYQAILSGERIAIYGDFDVDGLSGAAILTDGLSALGLDVVPYIPSRLGEGHGINPTALEKLLEKGVSLVISVDCGITSNPALRHKRPDIIITDHHTLTSKVPPPALAIINPKREDSQYPFTELSGSGVALKLLQAIYEGLGKGFELETMYDLVTLGTVADCVPLQGENRYLVKAGVPALRYTKRPGIRQLAKRAQVELENLDTDAISWALAPRLNAAGRMGQAIDSYRLLVTNSIAEAEELAYKLDKQNTERQQQTQEFVSRAREQVLRHGTKAALIAYDAAYPGSILGLVAGRLSEEFCRPAVVIRVGEATCTGSCRSIPEFDIISALKELQPLLSRFGGHSQAAGFSLPTRNLEQFINQFIDLADARLRELPPGPKICIDAEVTLQEIQREGKAILQQLAPFGTGNPSPTFLSHSVHILDKHSVGKNGEHLMLKLRQNGISSDGIAFRCKDLSLEASDIVDIIYNIKLDTWQGEERIRLNIIDFNLV